MCFCPIDEISVHTIFIIVILRSRHQPVQNIHIIAIITQTQHSFGILASSCNQILVHKPNRHRIYVVGPLQNSIKLLCKRESTYPTIFPACSVIHKSQYHKILTVFTRYDSIHFDCKIGICYDSVCIFYVFYRIYHIGSQCTDESGHIIRFCRMRLYQFVHPFNGFHLCFMHLFFICHFFACDKNQRSQNCICSTQYPSHTETINFPHSTFFHRHNCPNTTACHVFLSYR